MQSINIQAALILQYHSYRQTGCVELIYKLSLYSSASRIMASDFFVFFLICSGWKGYGLTMNNINGLRMLFNDPLSLYRTLAVPL